MSFGEDHLFHLVADLKEMLLLGLEGLLIRLMTHEKM